MRHIRTLSFPNGSAGSSRLPHLSDWFERRDLGRRVLLAANDRQTAYCVHLILAALFFSPFFLFGYTLFANADLVMHNYPMLLLAKRNFLSGSLGLWNPYTFSG